MSRVPLPRLTGDQAAIIRELLVRDGKSQVELARALNMSRQYLGNTLAGTTGYSPKRAHIIYRFFGGLPELEFLREQASRYAPSDSVDVHESTVRHWLGIYADSTLRLQAVFIPLAPSQKLAIITDLEALIERYGRRPEIPAERT